MADLRERPGQLTGLTGTRGRVIIWTTPSVSRVDFKTVKRVIRGEETSCQRRSSHARTTG
jgi:hypothetical protein